MGAWIETETQIMQLNAEGSHPVWVRGLKQKHLKPVVYAQKSHPVWVRGLKRRNEDIIIDSRGSHPVWVRGLKHNQ